MRFAARAALAAVVLGASPTIAQPEQTPIFASVPLPIEAIEGRLEASAQRAWVWDDAGSQRIVLERDVRLVLAGYDLTADRAALWIADTPNANGEQDSTVQVFGYLEGVDTPTSDASVAVTADDLRVQGVLRLVGPASVSADLIERSPTSSGFAQTAEQELRLFLEPLVGRGVPAADARLDETPLPAADESGVRAVVAADAEQSIAPARVPPEPIVEAEGSISLAAERVIRTTTEDGQAAVVLAGGMQASYALPGEDRVLELSAQRAVVFLSDDAAGGTTVRAGSVDGIYLEGNVIAADGDYVVRGPRVFYDIAQDQALILDGVFSTFDEGRGFPLYVRADSVRQLSRNEFLADNARVSNTAFARPNLSLGVSEVTITRVDEPDGEGGLRETSKLDAQHITLRAGTIPLAYLPRFRGDPEKVPLRDLRFVTSTDSGEEIRTRWDLFALLGRESPDGFSVNLLADALLDRGGAAGIRAGWDRGKHEGGILTYWVFDDTGTDVLTTGARVERDGETRGIVRGENRTRLDSVWTLFTEIAHVTDAAFTDAFFEDIAETGRAFQTRARLRRLEGNTAFWLEASGQIDDFVPNEYLIQSDGYSVERYPEASYTRLTDDLIPARPGLLTYSSESRIGFLRLQLIDATASEFGLNTNFRAQRALGIDADQTVADGLRAQGFDESPRFRFDTRHEVSAQLNAGPVQVTPFAVGRFTAYDDDFSQFGPGTGDAARWWAGFGMTLSTVIQRVYNGVYSQAFDVDRLRHVIRPSFTIFQADGTVDQNELPTYDESVESIAEGTVYRFGVEQTFQTKRGGPGRQYSVDYITLDAEFVLTGDNVDRESSIVRYDPSRPELSRLGDAMTLAGTWQATDAVALVGGMIYDFDNSVTSVATGGVVFQNTPTLSTFLRYRRLEDQDSTLLSTGADYDLSDKYTVNTVVTFDADESDFESVRLEVLRDFQSAVFGANLAYNNTSETTNVGVVFQPLGRGVAERIGVGTNVIDRNDRDDSPLGG
ncbi:MAG: hypothetical protein AAGB48_08975 [Planctomycetota bacterium]